MKRNKIITTIIAIALLTGFVPPLAQQTARAQTSVSFQVFYDQLSPYGTWVNYPDYGYVWVPGAGSGFRPYSSRGHWVYTEDGWAWVSDYDWGWATFHYGNWFYDDSYGWMWTPGYQWAPAWVTWGQYQGNYCWAPIGPRVDIGVSYGSYRPSYRYWNFCPREHITSTHISNYYVTNLRNTTVVNNITVINNINRGGGRGAWLKGPDAGNVERFTHRPVHPLAIQAAARPGAASIQSGHLAIYRPAVQSNNTAARPAAVHDLHALRPANGNHPNTPANNTANPAAHNDHPAPGTAHSQQPGASSNAPFVHRPAGGQQPHPQQPHPQQPYTQQPHPQPSNPATAPHRSQPIDPGANQRPVMPGSNPQHPVQQPPHPVQQPMQPRPAPAPRPMPQPHPQPVQPHPQPMQPRQMPAPHPNPPAPHPAPPTQRPAPPPPRPNPPHEHNR